MKKNKSKITEARKDYISWDEYFMGIAVLSSTRSKDPHTKHGVCIINPSNNHIVSVGYNGMPNGDDKNYSWDRDAKELENTKYPYVLHSEQNAILNCKNIDDLKGSVMYLFSERGYLPCNDCMKLIVQSGISEIVVTKIIDTNTDKYNWKPTLYMIKISKIKLRIIDHPQESFIKIGNRFMGLNKKEQNEKNN